MHTLTVLYCTSCDIRYGTFFAIYFSMWCMSSVAFSSSTISFILVFISFAKYSSSFSIAFTCIWSIIVIMLAEVHCIPFLFCVCVCAWLYHVSISLVYIIFDIRIKSNEPSGKKVRDDLRYSSEQRHNKSLSYSWRQRQTQRPNCQSNKTKLQLKLFKLSNVNEHTTNYVHELNRRKQCTASIVKKWSRTEILNITTTTTNDE